MKSIRPFLASCVLAGFNISLALADPITLEEVTAYALKESPEVRRIDAGLAEELGEALIVKTLPNPEIDSALRPPKTYSGNRPDSEFEIILSQPFRLSHLGLRQKLGELIGKAAGVNQKLAILEFSQNIKLSFAKTWALESQLEKILQARKRLSTSSKSITESSEKGLLPKSDVKLFQAQDKKLVAEIIGLEADILRSKAELIKLSGYNLAGRNLKKPELFAIVSENELLTRAQEGSIPVQERMQLLKKVASEQVRLAERDSFPLLAPGLIYQHTSDGIDQYGAGLKLQIPLFDRNQGERVKRKGEESAAQASALYYSGEAFNAELKTILASLQASKRQFELYDKEVIPALMDALKAYEEQLKSGQGNTFAIFQTQREIIDASSRSLELWTKALSAQSELSLLIGEEL